MNLDSIGKTIGDIFGWNKKKKEQPKPTPVQQLISRSPVNRGPVVPKALPVRDNTAFKAPTFQAPTFQQNLNKQLTPTFQPTKLPTVQQLEVNKAQSYFKTTPEQFNKLPTVRQKEMVKVAQQAETANRNLRAAKQTEKAIRDITSPVRNLASGIVSAVGQIPGTAVELAGNVGQLVTPDDKQQMFEEWSKTGQKYNKEVAKFTENVFQTKKDKGIVKDLSQTLGQLGFDVATGGIPAAVRHASMVYNDTFTQAKNMGKSDEEASLKAGANAGIQGFIEKLGMDKLLGPAGKNVVTRAMSRFLSEGSEESAQQLTDNLIKKSSDDRIDVFGGIDYAFLLGGLAGGGSSVAIDLTTGRPTAESQKTIKKTTKEVNKALEDAGSKVRVNEAQVEQHLLQSSPQVVESDPLSQLKQEAKKYKSAEEFVDYGMQRRSYDPTQAKIGDRVSVDTKSQFGQTGNVTGEIVDISHISTDISGAVDSPGVKNITWLHIKQADGSIEEIPASSIRGRRMWSNADYNYDPQQLTDIYNQAHSAPQVTKTPKVELGKETPKTNVNDLTISSKDPVYGYNGTAWKYYNARYDKGASLDNATTQEQFDDLYKGTTKAFNGSRDDIMYKDVLLGNKRVASPDNAAYNPLYKKLAQTDGLKYKEVDGQVYIGKNMSDINKVISGNLTPQEYYNLIGYKPERFFSQLPNITQITKTPVKLKQPTKKPVSIKEPVEINYGARQEIEKAMYESDAIIVDTMRAIEKQTGKTGLVDKFMYLSNMLRGSNRTANVILKTSNNIQQAFGQMSKQERAAFSDYANARTELSSAQEGIKTSKPVEELQSIVDNASADQIARFEALNYHYKQMADDLYDAGIIDKKTLDFYKSNNDYIRLQRDMGDKLPGAGTSGKRYYLGSTSTKQRRSGSGKATLDAGLVTAERTQQVYREIAKNKTGTFLVDSLVEAGLARKVPSSRASEYNTVTVFRDGKKEYYEVSPEMKENIDNINPYTMNIVMKIIAFLPRVFRAGTTGLNPVFIMRNLTKDQLGSAINSENFIETHSVKNIFSGLFNATSDALGANNNELYTEFLKHYGDVTSYDLTRNPDKARDIINRISGGRKAAIKYGATHLIRTAENFAAITEKSTRFQNFKGAYEAAINEGLPKEAAMERAAISAWQNSVDFSRAGTWGRVLNTIFPYWNPSVQGVRQTGRTLGKHPIKAPLTGLALVGIPLIAATLWNLSDDDEEKRKAYKNIPEYEKENNIIIIPPGVKQNKDGSYDVLKIPLPPGWKDLYMPLRRVLEAYYEDEPIKFQEIASDLLKVVSGPVSFESPDAFIGSMTPQAIKPWLQQGMNKDLFTGEKIVKDYMEEATDAEGKPVAEGKKAYKFTSGTAQIIGNKLNISPIRIEKFIKDTTSAVGMNTLNIVDAILNKFGVIPEEQVGGTSVTEGFKRSFGSVQGIENEFESAGAKYFKNLSLAQTGLNTNEKAAFTALHPSSKNFLGEVITDTESVYNSAARLDIYNRYPKVYEADKALDAINRQEKGYGNPLFDLTPEQLKKVLEKENLPPGSKDPELSNLYSQEWYADYAANKTAYFKKIQQSQVEELVDAKLSNDKDRIKALTASINKWESSDNPYPVATDEQQKAMDYYSSLSKGTGERSAFINGNPEIWKSLKNYWEQVDQWQNKQRAKRGLAATEGEEGKAGGYGTSSSSYGGGGKSSYRIGLKTGGELATPPTTSKAPVKFKSVAGTTIKKPTVKITKSKV